MKLRFLSLLVVVLLCSCTKEPKPEPEPPYQDFTSFVVWHNSDVVLTNCIAGCPDSIGYWHKLGDLGDLVKGVHSPEIIVGDSIDLVYIFTDYMCGGSSLYYANRLDTCFVIQKNIKNIFFMEEYTRGNPDIVKSDTLQYPH